jgi:uncharacterized Zn finger protein
MQPQEVVVDVEKKVEEDLVPKEETKPTYSFTVGSLVEIKGVVFRIKSVKPTEIRLKRLK